MVKNNSLLKSYGCLGWSGVWDTLYIQDYAHTSNYIKLLNMIYCLYPFVHFIKRNHENFPKVKDVIKPNSLKGIGFMKELQNNDRLLDKYETARKFRG